MINLNLVELYIISGGVITMNRYFDDSKIFIEINNYNVESNTLSYKDLTFTLNGCNYLGFPIISGDYYSGYKIEFQTLIPTSNEKKYYSSYVLTKV